MKAKAATIADPEKAALALRIDSDAQEQQQQQQQRTRSTRHSLALTLLLVLYGSFRILLHLVHSSAHDEQQPAFTVFPHPVNASVPPVHPLAPTPLAPWKPCPKYADQGFLCSYVRVPKDYTDPSAGYAHVAVSKYPATVSRKDLRGAIYLNPGGPGGSGITFSYRFAKTLSILTKGHYHIIGFDPRGIGATRPLVDCFGSRRAYELFRAGTALERAFDVAPDTFSAEGRQTLLRQWTEAQALKKAEMEICTRVMGDELRHMGTSTVVRDISFLNFEAGLGEGHPINFIGFSYGTILGAYLVNMLDADKIGRVVIDGVASAPGWTSMPPERWLPSGWMVDTEKAYEWLLRECSQAGPEDCPVTEEQGEDPEKINDRLMAFFDKLYHQPQAIPYGPRPGMLTSGIARAMLYRATNQPSIWPLISHFLADAMAGNGTQLYQLAIRPFATDDEDKEQEDLSRVAVSCGDSPPYDTPAAAGGGPAPPAVWPRPSPELLVNLTLGNFERYTPHFAASAPSIEPDGGCEWHPASGRTPERFAGPWNNTLKHNLFIISNTADPITPRSSGEEIHRLMGNDSSALLIVNTPGHCSLAGVSSCALRAYRDYFLAPDSPSSSTDTGLPAPGTVCERDEDTFHRKPAALMAAAAEGAAHGAVHAESTLVELARAANAQWIGAQFPHFF